MTSPRGRLTPETTALQIDRLFAVPDDFGSAPERLEVYIAAVAAALEGCCLRGWRAIHFHRILFEKRFTGLLSPFVRDVSLRRQADN